MYLASWGMLRGSTKLLQHSYKIHNDIIPKIVNRNTQKLIEKSKAPDFYNYLENIEEIESLYKNIEEYYDKNKIPPTDTLISKIILGTTSLMPAYDSNLKKGISEQKKYNDYLITGKYKISSLKTLFQFYCDNKDMFELANTRHFPPMKLIDMYFWQLGLEKKS